jgi:hypothetical protein
MKDYWKRCLEEFEEAFLQEKEQNEINDQQLKLLKKEIEYCKEQLNND